MISKTVPSHHTFRTGIGSAIRTPRGNFLPYFRNGNDIGQTALTHAVGTSNFTVADPTGIKISSLDVLCGRRSTAANSLANVPYSEVLSVWDRLLGLAIRNAGISWETLSTEQRDGVTRVFNSALTARPGSRRNCVILGINEARVVQGLNGLSIPVQNPAFSTVSYGTIIGAFPITDVGTTLAQKEGALKERDDVALGNLARIRLQTYTMAGGQGVQVGSVDALSDLPNVILSLEGSRRTILERTVQIDGRIGDNREAAMAVFENVLRLEEVEKLLEGARGYVGYRPHELADILMDMGFSRHENGIGPFLYGAGAVLDEGPLEYFRGRETARGYFIDPSKMVQEEARL